ncbi:MAG TPA: FAD-binding oxidoreductase [Thermoplasmata archaeon]|nr:FAD-binding oxidoreductase [Thermoplasmata archaeon]
MPESRVDVVILGAGIMGCALAHHLAARQVGPVVVYDPATPSAGATGRAAGIVTEQLWNAWDVAVTRESKEQYAELAARAEPGTYRVNGFARWTRDAEAARILADSVERLRGWGVDVRPIGPDELARRLPAGRFEDVEGAIFGPSDAVVTPSTITEQYAESARAAGVDFTFGVPMRSLAREIGGWALELPGRTVRARRLVVAAGAWSKRLLAGLGHALPLVPYRTQAAVLRPGTPTPDTLPSGHDLDTDVYARPEAAGRILAGDGTDLREADPETFSPGGDERFVGHLAETFAHRFPGWADAELVRAWAGVITATPDRRPIIGPVDSSEGLFAITGFNGFGVMRAGGAASRLAELMARSDGGTEGLDALSPVLPERFVGRSLEFVPRPGFTLEGGDAPRF